MKKFILIAASLALSACNNDTKTKIEPTPLREIVLFNYLTNTKLITVTGVCSVDFGVTAGVDKGVYLVKCYSKDGEIKTTYIEKNANSRIVLHELEPQPKPIPTPVIKYHEF